MALGGRPKQKVWPTRRGQAVQPVKVSAKINGSVQSPQTLQPS
jgi:hypothetical protein